MLQSALREYKDYQGLIVYQRAFGNSTKLLLYYKNQKPLWCERFVIEQLLRSLSSVGANIVEGYGRNSSTEFKRFLVIAKGSAMESEYWISVLLIIRSQDREILEELQPLNKEVIKMLSTMIKNRLKIEREPDY